MVVPEPVTDPRGRLFCYALTDDAWVVGGAISNGGIVGRWVLDLVGGARDSDLARMAEEVPAGAEGLVMIPMLLAERAPLWDPTLHGALLGLRHHHTQAHVARRNPARDAGPLEVLADGSRDRLVFGGVGNERGFGHGRQWPKCSSGARRFRCRLKGLRQELVDLLVAQ